MRVGAYPSRVEGRSLSHGCHVQGLSPAAASCDWPMAISTAYSSDAHSILLDHRLSFRRGLDGISRSRVTTNIRLEDVIIRNQRQGNTRGFETYRCEDLFAATDPARVPRRGQRVFSRWAWRASRFRTSPMRARRVCRISQTGSINQRTPRARTALERVDSYRRAQCLHIYSMWRARQALTASDAHHAHQLLGAQRRAACPPRASSRQRSAS